MIKSAELTVGMVPPASKPNKNKANPDLPGDVVKVENPANTNGDKGKVELSFNDWLPWILGGGTALLSHSLASSIMEPSDEERRRDSVWSRLLRAIIPIGVGAAGAAGGYYLGDALKKTAQSNDGNGKSYTSIPIYNWTAEGPDGEEFTAKDMAPYLSSMSWDPWKWGAEAALGIPGAVLGYSGAKDIRDWWRWDPENPIGSTWSGRREIARVNESNRAADAYDARVAENESQRRQREADIEHNEAVAKATEKANKARRSEARKSNKLIVASQREANSLAKDSFNEVLNSGAKNLRLPNYGVARTIVPNIETAVPVRVVPEPEILGPAPKRLDMGSARSKIGLNGLKKLTGGVAGVGTAIAIEAGRQRNAANVNKFIEMLRQNGDSGVAVADALDKLSYSDMSRIAEKARRSYEEQMRQFNANSSGQTNQVPAQASSGQTNPVPDQASSGQTKKPGWWTWATGKYRDD